MSLAPALAVAATNDPRDAKTWSGTPANIIAALELKGIRVAGIGAEIGGVIRQGTYYALYHSKGGLRRPASMRENLRRAVRLSRSDTRSDYHWDAPARAYRSRRVLEQISDSGCNRVLHMSSLTLPIADCRPGPLHYLYCDNTWHTLHRLPLPADRFSQAALDSGAALERRAFQSVTHFFPTADYVHEDLVEHYGIDPSHITTVGTGRGAIEPAAMHSTSSDNFILFCAKVRFEEKGGPLLVEAFKRARSVDERLKLVLVGHEHYPGLVQDVPGAIGLGQVSWTELQRLFHDASLFAMPALNEPWGLVYLEALASRTPILGLRRNALPEMTGGGRFGFLIDEPDPDAVASGILDAYSDPDRLRRMGDEGQRFCLDRYSWDRVASEIIATIRLE